MPKLNFSGNIPTTTRNNIPKIPVNPTGVLSKIQDGVQDGRPDLKTVISPLKIDVASQF